MLHVFYIYMNVNIYMVSFVTVSSVLMGLSICWYCCSVAQSCLTMWRHGVTVCQASPSFIISLSLFKLVFFESVMPSDQLILCRPLLLLLQSFPASGSFPVSHVFASGGQSIGASASASVLPMNIQGWFPLGLTGLISLLSKGLSNLLQHHTSKLSILSNWWKKAERKASFMVRLSHLYKTTGKTIALSVALFVYAVQVLGNRS